MSAILVCGATGTTGGEVLRQLQAVDGVTPRALTRSEASVEKLREAGVDAVVGDLAAPATLPAALEGVDAVYVANPSSDAQAAHEGALAAAAHDAGARLLVKLSVIGAAPDAPLEFGRLHAAAEVAIAATGIPATILRPNGFMQNTLAWAAQIPGGAVYGPVMDARWSIVDVRDIAAVAVAALTDPAAHAGQSYTLTGPAPLSTREEIAIVAGELGRELTATEVPIEAAQETIRGYGADEATVARLGELWQLYADGLAQDVSPDIETVTGAPARDFARFAADHRAAFGGGGG